MAFSFPNYQYQPYPQQGYGQNYPQMQQQIQPPAQQPTPQIQNGGFVSVRSEIEARNYPVAPGNSVTFKDEYSPYVYTKTMGFSSLDRPVFEKYKLVKEEVAEESQIAVENVQTENLPHYVTESEFNDVRGQIDALQRDIESLKEQANKKTTTKAKKEDKEEEET